MACSSKKSNKYAGGGRIKSNTTKAGVTRDRKRRYSCGGKLKTK
jgi:hypothetical protein